MRPVVEVEFQSETEETTFMLLDSGADHVLMSINHAAALGYGGINQNPADNYFAGAGGRSFPVWGPCKAPLFLLLENKETNQPEKLSLGEREVYFVEGQFSVLGRVAWDPMNIMFSQRLGRILFSLAV